MGAVIDDRAFAKHKAAIDRAHATSRLDVVAGGTYDDSVGYFVRPTVVESSDPTDEIVQHRVLRADPRRARLPRPPVRQGARPDGVVRALRA